MAAAVFVDTFAFLAMLNGADERHAEAMRWFDNSHRPLVTTEWILTELADGLCAPRVRPAVIAVEQRLRGDSRVTIVASAADLFRHGFSLFTQRLDKEWSLTDCISFIVMKDRGITEALTGDHHFEQAGFIALLK